MARIVIWAGRRFTLVEMLVILAIILVLAALLMPMLHSGIEQARTVRCLGNLRQIGSAHQMYINDSYGFVVPAEWRNESNWSGIWVKWAGTLVGLSYIDAPRNTDTDPPTSADSVLMCPSGRSDARCSWSIPSLDDPNIYRGSIERVYGSLWNEPRRFVNVWYANNGSSAAGGGYPNWRVAPDDDNKNYKRHARFRRIISPAQTVCNFDGAFSVIYNDAYKISRRHSQNRIVNILFWDGRAASTGSEEVPMPGTVWNKTHLNNYNPRIKWLVTQ